MFFCVGFLLFFYLSHIFCELLVFDRNKWNYINACKKNINLSEYDNIIDFQLV